LIVSLVIAIILITAVPTQTFAAKAPSSSSNGVVTTPITIGGATQSNPYRVDLIAGGGNVNSAMDVGDVLIWNDANNLYIKYVMAADGINIAKAQAQVATSLADIPQSNGNPVPGQFDYKSPELGYVSEFTFTIPLKASWTAGTQLIIAAHADVGRSGITSVYDFQPTLPDKVYFTNLPPYTGGPSYLPDICISGGSSIDGHYNGWCIDSLHSISSGGYQAKVFSSYGTLPPALLQTGIIAHPENLGAVNWIINQNIVGTTSTSGSVYTYGDVQFAIWMLLINPDLNVLLSNSNLFNSFVGTINIGRITEIYNNALTHTDFIPGPCQKLGVILVPINSQGYFCAQVMIIGIPIPCIPPVSETAWASITSRDSSGTITALYNPFPGKNWATYVA
jgi:hypothetical protein